MQPKKKEFYVVFGFNSDVKFYMIVCMDCKTLTRSVCV